MNRLSPFTRASFLASIAVLAMPGTAAAALRTVSATAQPVDAGKEIQFYVNVVDSAYAITAYKVWLDGNPEPPRVIQYSSSNPTSLNFGNPGGGGAGGSVAIILKAPAQSTRIRFKVFNVKNEQLDGSVAVTVKSPAPANATRITSARYNGGTIDVTFDGVAGAGAKIEADIWPLGGAGIRCIDQSVAQNSTSFSKNVTASLKAPGKYQSRVHLIRNGQLVGFADIHGIVR